MAQAAALQRIFFLFFSLPAEKANTFSLPGSRQQHLPRSLPPSIPSTHPSSLPRCRKPGENLGEVSGQCTACKQKLPCPPWTQMFPIDPPVGLAECNRFRTSCSPSCALSLGGARQRWKSLHRPLLLRRSLGASVPAILILFALFICPARRRRSHP